MFVCTACLRSVPYGVPGVKSGRLFGWLMNLLALPNSGFTSHSSLIGSRTTSLTLQDLIFPVAWFLMCRYHPSCSIRMILYPALHLRSHFPGVLFLKYTLSPTLNPDSALSVVLSALRNLLSSKYFLAMDSDSRCRSRHNNPESGSPKNLVSGWSS